VDGVPIARPDASGSGLVEFSPSADAIGEFKVQMSNYSAEYGETGGGIANFSIKSGTNVFHGSVYDYLRNPALNANGLINNAFGVPKASDKANDFGGTLGGPIKKGRAFFFGSYEGTRYGNFGLGGKITLPTPAMKQGDFSARLGDQIGTDALGPAGLPERDL
jgi:hypothetical protein